MQIGSTEEVGNILVSAVELSSYSTAWFWKLFGQHILL